MYIYIYIYICVCIYIYIYIYILIYYLPAFTVTRKKNPPGTRDKNISNHRPGGKRKNIIGPKKKRPTPSHQLKKIKRYAVSWSKEKENPPYTLQCSNYISTQHEWSQLLNQLKSQVGILLPIFTSTDHQGISDDPLR